MEAENNIPEWLPERLERARHTAVRELLSQFGFEDEAAFKQAFTEQQAAIQQLTLERDAALQRATEAEHARHQLRLEMAFQQAAAPYEFFHLDEARALADLSGVQVDEQGGVIGMREALEALVEKRPHLIRRPFSPSLDAAIGRENRAAEEKSFSPEEVDSIKRRFRMLR